MGKVLLEAEDGELDDLLDLLQYWEVVAVDPGTFKVPVTRLGVILNRAPYTNTEGA